MNTHNTERISALADGELKGIRRFLAERHLHGCATCAAEYQQIKRVRQMLQDNPPTAQMSDTAEFFWSKVKRGIEQRGDEPVEVPMPGLSLGDWLGQRRFVLAGVAAVVVAMIGALWLLPGRPVEPGPVGHFVPNGFAKVDKVSTPIPETAVTAFDSQEANATVIWVSGLPWTADMDEMKNQFENLEI